MIKKIIIASSFLLGISNIGHAQETPASNVMNSDLANVQNRCIVRLDDNINSSEVHGLAHACAVIMVSGCLPATDGTANNDPNNNDSIIHL